MLKMDAEYRNTPAVLKDVEAFASLTSGNQKEWFEMLLKSDVVKCVSVAEALTDKQLARLKAFCNFKPRECYKNASLVCLYFPEVEYCEGRFMFHGIPIEHAFNKIGDKYFDVTMELALGAELPDEYACYKVYKSSKVLDYLAAKRVYGGILEDEFRAKVAANRIVNQAN